MVIQHERFELSDLTTDGQTPTLGYEAAAARLGLEPAPVGYGDRAVDMIINAFGGTPARYLPGRGQNPLYGI